MAWRGPNSSSNNPVPNKVNMPELVSDVLRHENRAKNVRRDTDTVKNFSVNLIDIDTTIIKYISEQISPQVVDNGQIVKVPVNYASPEKWKAIKKDGFLRDKNGKIQCPSIALRRTTMQRNDQLITLNRHLTYPATKLYSEKNQYDKFSQMNDFAKTREIFNVTAPDHVMINYDFIVWTDYIEQMDPIIEAINFSTEDYWGDKARYKFRTSISDYNFQTEAPADGDRVVKTTFTMIVYAYLLPETFENHKQTVEKSFTPRKIIFDAETVGDITSVGGKKRARRSVSYPSSSYSSSPSPSLKSTSDSNIVGKSKSSYALWADKAGVSDFSSFSLSSSFAQTAGGFPYQPGVPTVVSSLAVYNPGVTGSLITNNTINVSTSTSVDSFSASTGNMSSWLVSINDGTNYLASTVMANWNKSGTVEYTEISTNQIGYVPVFLSVIYNSGVIYLIASPTSGTWSVKVFRTSI